MLRHRLPVVVLAGALAACGQGVQDASVSKAPDSARAPVLLIAPEDLHTIGAVAQARGPVILGSIQPERRADLRAEVQAVVLQVLRENGEAVRRGELLVRLDATAIRDSLASAEEAARASSQAFEQAERTLQRLKTLQAQGMTSIQALEDAEVRRNTAQSDLVATKARVATARQQLQRTEARAPFDGVVSDRKVSSGDTVQIGRELLKVLDPATMRFEGLVSADRMHELKIGQAVSFRVNGYPGAEFRGKVERIGAAANATTRQVEVLVAFADANAPRVAGLYAEGRIDTGGEPTLAVPESAVVRGDDGAHVWRVNDRTLQKVSVRLGERDERRGEYPLRGGLADGDRILRNPGTTLVDGQRIELMGSGAGTVLNGR
jgi:RND family efflux transporter MFP subunit